MVKDMGVGISRRRKTNLFRNVVSADSTVKESNDFGLYGVAKLVEKLKRKDKSKKYFRRRLLLYSNFTNIDVE